jgi:VanZ family protein
MKSKLLRYVPVVVWMCLMFYLSSRSDLPSGATQEADFFSKKLAHIAEYFILNILWFHALGKKSPAQATLYSLVFAFSDEIHQLFIPGRTGKLRDVGIDFIGISSASLLLLKFPKWKNSLSPAPLKKHKK